MAKPTLSELRSTRKRLWVQCTIEILRDDRAHTHNIQLCIDQCSKAIDRDTPPVASVPMTFEDFSTAVRTLLANKPPGTGLADPDDVSEYVLDGDSLMTCPLCRSRRDSAVVVDEGTWDSILGCFRGARTENAYLAIHAPVFVPPRE